LQNVANETIVNLIKGTTTTKGLRIDAQLDDGIYEKGKTFSEKEMAKLDLERHKKLKIRIYFAVAPKVKHKRERENEKQRCLPRNWLPYRRQSNSDRACDSQVSSRNGYKPERSQGFMHCGLQKHRVVTRSLC